jgi:chemotaxis protein MotB
VGKHQKHEEHVNHERWLVSFADMMTLLFALFVVLYAMGVTEVEKIRQVQRSIQFAFHIAGEGKTKDEGLYDNIRGAGDLPEPAPLINAQDGAMKEFLLETLPREFEEVTGKSLDIVQTDDTLCFRAPLSTFFDAGRAHPVRRDVYNWLVKVVQGSLSFTSDVQLRIEAPDVIVGERGGRPVTSFELCERRLATLRKVALGIPQVRPEMVCLVFRQQPDAAPGSQRAAADWEERAQVIVAFSNEHQANR